MDQALIERMKAELAAPSPQPTAAPPEQQPQQSQAAPSSDDAQRAGMEPDAGAVGATQDGSNTVSTGDVGNAALGAGRDALQGAWETAWHALAPVARFADRHGLNVLGAPSELHETQPELPSVDRADESKGGAGLVNTGRDVGRFILGFIGAGSLLKGLGAAEGVATSVTAGGLGDFVVSGAHDPRIVDFLTEFPELKGGFLEALADAGKGDDNYWQRKLEVAGEGILSGAAMEGVIKVAGILRKAIVAQREGDGAAAKKIVEDAQPELQQAYEDLQKTPAKAEEPPPPPADDAVALKTNGETYDHPADGQLELPLSDTAKAEIKKATADGDAHFDALSPETQNELKAVLPGRDEIDQHIPPKYEPTFKLDDTNRAEFDEALKRTLDTSYATLRAEAPGTALEDVLGNYFNYSKYTGPDQAKVILSDLANAMKPQIDAAGGGAVRTWKEANAELSDWLGVKSPLLTGTLQQLAGTTNLDTIMTATRVLIHSQTNDILKLATMVRAGTATEADKLRLRNTREVLADVAGLAKNTQRNLARGLASMRQSVGEAVPEAEAMALRKELDDETWKFVSNLLGMTDGSPKSVIKIATDPSLLEKGYAVLHDFWVNAALGHWATQTVNFLSNARNTALYPLYRMAGGAITYPFTGNKQAIQIGMAQYSAIKNHVFDSIEMARRAFMENAPVLDSKMQQLEGPRLGINADTFGLNGNPFGTAITHLGNVIGLPTRFLTTGDEFFGQLNYRASVEARARVEAVNKKLSTEETVPTVVNGETQMKSPTQLYVEQKMDEAFNAESKTGYGDDGSLLNPEAMADSRKSKFTQPLKTATWLGDKSIGEAVEWVAKHVPFTQHLLFPFVKVPANIFRAMVDESPLAPIRRQFWKDVNSGDDVARADAIGRLALGSMFTTGIAFLTAEGFITGGGPQDPDRQRQWRAAGNIPYSIHIPGTDWHIPYNRLDPIAGQMGMVADFAYLSAHVDDKTRDNMAIDIAMSLANNLNNKGYLQSLTDVMAGIKASRQGDSGRATVERVLQSRLASYVPSALDNFNSDDTIRDVRGYLDAIMKKIPGLSQGLAPRFDNFGEPMLYPQGWPWRNINPFTPAQGPSGPARDEMNYWGEGPTAAKFAMPHPVVGGKIDLREYNNPYTGKDAYTRWLELVGSPMFNGKTTEQDMNELVRSDGYKALKKGGVEDPFYTDHPAVQLLKDSLNQHYEIAREKMLSERGFENLRGALNQFKVGQKAVPAGVPMPANPTLDQLLKAK